MQNVYRVRNVHGETTLNLAAYEEYQKELNDRRAMGRYTLDEAALTLEQEAGESASDMLKRLMKAALDAELPMYEPGKLSQCISSKIQKYYEEAYWDDLNTWLDAHDQRLVWRFPAPAIEPTPDADHGGKEAASLENWKMRVQSEAATRWRKLRKSGCNPTPHMLKDELARWCREENVRTKSNINPTAEYLYRHVLSAKHWTPPKDD